MKFYIVKNFVFPVFDIMNINVNNTGISLRIKYISPFVGCTLEEKKQVMNFNSISFLVSWHNMWCNVKHTESQVFKKVKVLNKYF